MKKRIISYFFGCCFLFIGIHSKATYFEFVIKVKDESEKSLPNSYATAYVDGKKQAEFKADANGEVLTKLDFGKKYIVEVEDKNHEKIEFRVNTNIPNEMQKYVYNFKTTIRLIRKKEGYKVVYTENPSIDVFYNKEKDKFALHQEFVASYNYVPINQSSTANNANNQSTNTVANNAVKNNTTTNAQNNANNQSTNQPITNNNTPKNIEENPKNMDDLPTPKNAREDREIEIEKRLNEAKTTMVNADKDIEQEKGKELSNYSTLAMHRRSFLEEIAESRRFLKQVEVEQSNKRLPDSN